MLRKFTQLDYPHLSFLIGIFAGVLLLPQTSMAIDTDDFESYGTGDLQTVTSGVWGDSGNDFDIDSTDPYEGTRYLQQDSITIGATTSSTWDATTGSQVMRFALKRTNALGNGRIKLIDQNEVMVGGIYMEYNVNGEYDIWVDGASTSPETEYRYKTGDWVLIDTVWFFGTNEIALRARSSTDTASSSDWIWGGLQTSTSTTGLTWSIRDTNSGRIAIDNWGIGHTSSEDTTTISSCPDGATCWYYSDPAIDQVFASTSAARTHQGIYKVSEDDYVDLQFGCDPSSETCEGTYLDLTVRHKTSGTRYEYTDTALLEGSNPYSHAFDNTATGTYEQCLRIYTHENNWKWIPFLSNTAISLIYNQCRNYVVVSATSDADISAYWDGVNSGAIETSVIIDEQSDYVGTTDDLGVFATAIHDLYFTLIHMPPWGFVTVFVETLHNGSSTQLGTITMSFPTSSPMYGTTLDLDIDTGFATAIQTIRDEGYTSEHGDSFDTFLYWWNLAIYMMFSVWVLKAILGVIETTTSSGRVVAPQKEYTTTVSRTKYQGPYKITKSKRM